MRVIAVCFVLLEQLVARLSKKMKNVADNKRYKTTIYWFELELF